MCKKGKYLNVINVFTYYMFKKWEGLLSICLESFIHHCESEGQDFSDEFY